MNEPGYWMYESTSVLRPVIEAYLRGEPLNPEQTATMRSYLRQWIWADVWDSNPHADLAERAWLAGLRLDIDDLTNRKAITEWLDRATEGGMDPL